MKQFLDRFVLGIPLLFIKQFPYAWILVIALWSWPPIVSGAIALIIVIGLLAMEWQAIAWLSNMRREHAVKGGKFYVDRPAIPLWMAAQRLAILMVIAGVLGWLLKGQFSLSFWQIFLLMVGFTILYRDSQFFGAPTIYVITDEGIGVRFAPGHIDYRLFLNFKEISHIERTSPKSTLDWDVFARTRNVKEGLLLNPKSQNGFTKRIQKLFIAPQDIQKFLEQLPPGYVMPSAR